MGERDGGQNMGSCGVVCCTLRMVSFQFEAFGIVPFDSLVEHVSCRAEG